MGTLFRLSIYYVYRLHALFIHLIPADALPRNSTPIGIIGALCNRSYHELYSPRKKEDELGLGTRTTLFFFLLLFFLLSQNYGTPLPSKFRAFQYFNLFLYLFYFIHTNFEILSDK